MSNYDVLNESRKELVNTIVELMKQEGLNWTKCWASAVRPYNPVSDIKYRGGNKIRLSVAAYVNEYVDPRWLTYKQAQEAGWQVKKGSQGVRLEKWIFERTETVKDPITGKDKKQTVQLERPIPYYFTVFNASQIDGIPELETKEPLPRDEMFKLAADVVASSECQVKRTGLGCFYIPAEDTLYLPPADAFNSNESYLATALHEMAHSTGHSSRLNRNIINSFGSADYAKEELVAELASAFTQQQLELDLTANIENHAAYLQSWIKALENDPNELYRAATEAEKASERIIHNYELYIEKAIGNERESASLPSLSEEQENLVHELDMFLDQYLTTSGSVHFDINTLKTDVEKGDIQKYLDILTDYRNGSNGKILPGELIQLCTLAKMLELQSSDKEPSALWDIQASIESTNDHSDYYFHSDRTENKDFYRIVYINSYGDIQPLTSYVFNTPEEASEYLKTINAVQEIPYNNLVNNVPAARNIPETKQLRETYYEKLEELKEKMNAIGWRFMFAYGQETSWCKFNEQHEIQDIKFDRLSDVEDYLEEIQIETEIIDSEPRRYSDHGERLYGGKTAAEFTPEDVKKFLEETERLLNLEGISIVAHDKASFEERLSGDDLLNAQELINQIKSVGGEVDRNGNVTVYHRTDSRSAEIIKSSQIMIGKEDGLFFSTKETGQNIGYGESVIKLSIPVENLILDDIFSDELHLRYPLGAERKLDISSYLYVSDPPIFEIYQLNDSEAASKYRFESMRYIKSQGITINQSDYNLVYTAPLEGMNLDQIFEKFNIDHPSDFTGHSLSISDVVVLHQDGKTTSYYVDSIGFKEIPDFFKDISKDKSYKKTSIADRLAAKKAELENNKTASKSIDSMLQKGQHCI